MMQETKSFYSRPRNLLLNTPKDTVESLCELQANHFRDQSNFPSESESASKEVSGEPRVLVDPLSTRALFRGRIPSLNEVESQLERMFAGVDGSHNDHGMQHGQKDCGMYDGINKNSRNIPIKDLQGMSSTSVPLVTPVRFSEVRYVEQDIKSSENDELERRIKNEGIDFDLSGCGGKGLPGSRNIIGKCKSPAIRMRSSKCDTSDVRIQYPSRENDDERNKERRKISSSGPILKQTKASRRGIPDYFGKSRRSKALNRFGSLQSDVSERDQSWACTFCRKKSHSALHLDIKGSVTACAGSFHTGPSSGLEAITVSILSNLFGPYVISKITKNERSAKSGLNSRGLDRDDPCTDQRISRSIRQGERWPGTTGVGVEEVRHHRPQDGSSLSHDQSQQEVWFHEECITWASGVTVSGGTLCGLENAVRIASRMICDVCGFYGSTISCGERECKSTSHYGCAVSSGWFLDENCQLAWCGVHKRLPDLHHPLEGLIPRISSSCIPPHVNGYRDV